jgi:hypothetical protein
MMIRLVIVFIAATALYAALRMLLGSKRLSVRQFFAVYLGVLMAIVLVYLGVTGRLHPLFAVIGFALPFLSRILTWLPRGVQAFGLYRMIQNFLGGAPTSASKSGQKSELNTRFVHMILFHDTGRMDGNVIEGQFKDARLSDLTLDQIQLLCEECRVDHDSLSVLEAYLDREHPNWRDSAGGSTDQPGDAGSDSNLTERQAFEILGLDQSATRDEVIKAHRRLMQRMHPDRGGSTYLAARLNEAKSLLLDKLGKDRA